MNKKKIYLIIIHILAIVGLVFIAVYVAIMLGFTKTAGIKDLNRVLGGQNSETTDLTKNNVENNIEKNYGQKTDWVSTEEYLSFKKSVVKDAEKINTAGKIIGIDSRLIVSALLVEQIRLYTDSSREVFKKVFEPLSILGIQSQYSWGVMGLKQETAIEIEKNLKDKNSPYYLGAEFENLLDFKTDDHDTERFDRIIDEDNQLYSYLYTAIYMKQVMNQWRDAGFSIDNKPEIIATLYNIGFQNSKPKPDPSSGGAVITVGGKTYSFGDLASQFYNSNELISEFPRN
jgi:hypothetical protein